MRRPAGAQGLTPMLTPVALHGRCGRPGDTPGPIAWDRSNGETVMDAVVKPLRKAILSDEIKAAAPQIARPSREDAEAAVRTLIAFAGDDPAREGLIETPKRVIDAYEELYRGYRECPADVLERTFKEIGTYDDFVLVRGTAFNSQC